MSLGKTRRRLSFERRLRLWIALSSLPMLLLLFVQCRAASVSPAFTVTWLVVAFAFWCLAGSFFFENITRPLQTLSNIVASLREEDYAFRARGARRNDAMGDLALEINALASTLQRQRNSAVDALALVDSVISSMPSPLLAFDGAGRLRLVNAAAERTLHLHRLSALGADASQLRLSNLASSTDGEVYRPESDGRSAPEGTSTRLSVRRSVFRLNGVPHTLFVLSDVGAALREEERLAWQRLIRVLGHEINNSLTPIKSIAAMLRTRALPHSSETRTTQDVYEFRRGLVVIEDRADSLNRFLQAYQHLSRLPHPVMQVIDLRTLVDQAVPIETRLQVEVTASPDVSLQGDPDQLQQVLINLVKNAADAALHADANNRPPHVQICWTLSRSSLSLQIIDSGQGIANAENLFVPFYTTKQDGAGIGLTLSRQIIAAHHGSLKLTNRTDAPGCVAEITLPLSPSST